MANLVVNGDTVTVALSAAEKAWALRTSLTFPRGAVAGVRLVPDGMAEVRGLRLPGTYFPGVIKVGTWRGGGGPTFAVCRGHGRAIVIDLDGQHYRRVVMTVADPEDAVSRLS